MEEQNKLEYLHTFFVKITISHRIIPGTSLGFIQFHQSCFMGLIQVSRHGMVNDKGKTIRVPQPKVPNKLYTISETLPIKQYCIVSNCGPGGQEQLLRGIHNVKSWFPLFRLTNFPDFSSIFRSFPVFFKVLFLFKVWYHICRVFTIAG